MTSVGDIASPPVPELPVVNKVPNVMSLGRLAFGLGQSARLLLTSPEERTWGDAGRTAAAAVTDKIDGVWSRRFGSTEHGPTLDRLADVAFSVGGEVALAINGEISPIHPVLSAGRETFVQTMRQTASSNGRPSISVGSRGQQKTTAKMSMLAVARSPLSQHSGLVESMASVSSALSLISGAGYAQQYFAGRRQAKQDQPELTSSARNGGWRQRSASPNEWVARKIHEKFPDVTPDHLTFVGKTMVMASDLAALIKPKWGAALAAGPYTLGGIIDGWDGNLARIKGINSLEGMLNDVKADKQQEIFTAAVNSLLASRRGNRVAASQYAVAATTATLPALLRATAEAKGHIVSEDASGSRVIRGIEGGVGLGLNSQTGVSNTVSALMMVGNVLTAAQRAEVAVKGSASPHYRGANDDLEFREQAQARRNALLPIAMAGLAIGAGLLAKEQRKHR